MVQHTDPRLAWESGERESERYVYPSAAKDAVCCCLSPFSFFSCPSSLFCFGGLGLALSHLRAPAALAVGVTILRSIITPWGQKMALLEHTKKKREEREGGGAPSMELQRTPSLVFGSFLWHASLPPCRARLEFLSCVTCAERMCSDRETERAPKKARRKH